MTAEHPLKPPPTIGPCKKCGDFGFTGNVPLTGKGWLAKDVFELGVPCSCEAGREFAEYQKEWMKPMPKGRERD